MFLAVRVWLREVWVIKIIPTARLLRWIPIILFSRSQNSAKIIRTSVFGLDENLKIRNRFSFPANKLNITSIDIQSVEPVDQRTRDALQKSVQLAIEITTNSQEAAARWAPSYTFFYRRTYLRQLKACCHKLKVQKQTSDIVLPDKSDGSAVTVTVTRWCRSVFLGSSDLAFCDWFIVYRDCACGVIFYKLSF